MQPPITSLEDINDLTEAMNAALILFAKAFQLTAPTNNNQRTSSNPHNRHIAQPVMNISQDRQTQNVGGNSGNQFGQYARQSGLVVVPGIANQNGTGNVVATRADGTGIGNQARCYNCRGLGHIARSYTARPRRRDAAYLQTQMLIVQKEEAGIQLQAEEFNFMAAVDGSAEVHLNDNCYDNEIFNMFTQEEQYMDLLEPIPEPQLVPQNNNHVTSVGQKRHLFPPMEEKKKLKHDFKTQEDKFFDKEVDLEAIIKDLENILLKRDQMVQTMHVLNPKPDSFYHPNQKMALGYPNPSYLKKAQLKQQSLYNGNLLLEEHDPPAVYDSEETLELAQKSREKMRFLKKEIKPANYAKINHLSVVFVLQTTKSKEELFLSNVLNMVTISKMISIPYEDVSDDTTPSVTRKFLNEVKSSLVTLQRVVKQKMTLEVHNWSSSAHKEVHRIISHNIALIINQVDARVQNFEIQFLQEAAKFVRDFKSLTKEADESLDKQKYLELKIERLLKESVSHDIMSIVQNGFVDVPSDLQTELDRTEEKLELYIIKKEKEYAVLWNNRYTKCEECKYDKISYDKAYNDMQQKVERLQAQLKDLKGKSSDTPSASNTLDPLNQKLKSKIVELEFQGVNYEREISHLKTTYKNLFDSIKSNWTHAKLYKLIYENAQLRAWVFENTSESMSNTLGTSVTPHVDKPKLSVVTPHSKKLHASIPSHSVPQPRKFNVVKHRNVIAPGMFKINLSQTYRVDLVPNKQSSASIRTNPITNSQRHVIVKEIVSFNTITASSTGTLLLSKNHKTISSECNNIKLAIQNDKSEIVCDTCKQCLVTANHDACLPSSVNALNSRVNNLCANVSLSVNQKRHRTQVWKPKQVGSKERLACKPRLHRLNLKWLPSGRSFDLKGKLVAFKETNCPNDDKTCTSNPQEPIRKRFPNSTVFLGRLSKFVYGNLRFRNDHIAAILGYDDLKWGNITITRVYCVKGLGHNLFSVGQICDADLEVAFTRNTCFIRDLDAIDLLKGNRSTNLYTINLYDTASASPICLMARATSTKSWLWHQ
uniref:Integrase, catalytic region, zinc finger, CCHC-type, peptidase aspartic, catalytic n=1 Tax=Tanacetum cinerariifolium TaxID=118510 RepID=A0A699HEZ4_TANCI|nr:hypothetical protein [Tanacetum cinerariifolium]